MNNEAKIRVRKMSTIFSVPPAPATTFAVVTEIELPVKIVLIWRDGGGTLRRKNSLM